MYIYIINFIFFHSFNLKLPKMSLKTYIRPSHAPNHVVFGEMELGIEGYFGEMVLDIVVDDCEGR